MKEGFLAFLKILTFLLLLPLIAAVALSFYHQVAHLHAPIQPWVFIGVLSYIFLNFFIYDFSHLFSASQLMTSKIFAFAGSLSNSLGLLVPVFSLIVIAAHLLLIVFGKAEGYLTPFYFLLGFSLAMHLILAARQLQEDASPLRAQYFFGFGLIFTMNLVIMALLLAWVIPEFSLGVFFKSIAAQTVNFYKSAYKLLFVG